MNWQRARNFKTGYLLLKPLKKSRKTQLLLGGNMEKAPILKKNPGPTVHLQNECYRANIKGRLGVCPAKGNP